MSKHAERITVYHGSPAVFQKFDLSKIGSGEGAQAFGWGLYFSSSREAADYYRKVLAFYGSSVDRLDESAEVKDLIKRAVKDLRPLLGSSPEFVAKRALVDHLTVDLAKLSAARHRYIMEHDAAPPEEITTKMRNITRAFSVIEKLDKLGQFYEVSIPDNHAYLLWDADLANQPCKVLDALSKLNIGEVDIAIEEATSRPLDNAGEADYGRDLYWLLNTMFKNDHKAVSIALLDVGIDGIKYLDGGSRDDGKGTYNYVVFDDAVVKITGILDHVTNEFVRLQEGVSPDNTSLKTASVRPGLRM